MLVILYHVLAYSMYIILPVQYELFITGIDPIEGVDFATNEMNSGISLPPDVLLGLKFSDKESESVDVSAKVR